MVYTVQCTMVYAVHCTLYSILSVRTECTLLQPYLPLCVEVYTVYMYGTVLITHNIILKWFNEHTTTGNPWPHTLRHTNTQAQVHTDTHACIIISVLGGNSNSIQPVLFVMVTDPTIILYAQSDHLQANLHDLNLVGLGVACIGYSKNLQKN